MTGLLFPSDFWNRRLLQVAHGEGAVWFACVALGAGHRRWEVMMKAGKGAVGGGIGGSKEGFGRLAGTAYARSMRLARDITDPLTLLVLSFGLTAVTSIMGKWVESRVHITAGQRLLDELKRRSCGRGEEVESAVESFVRMDLQAITLNEAQAPYPEPESSAAVIMEEVCASGDELKPGGTFESLSKAGFRLFELCRRFLIVAGLEGRVPGEKIAKAERDVRGHVSLWEETMMRYLMAAGTPSGEKKCGNTTSALLSLKLYHTFLRLLLDAGTVGPETRFDAYLAHFERMVVIAGALMRATRSYTGATAFMTLEPGIIIPLYLTASRCRHPILRRKALDLLRQANSQEGRWHSVGSAAVADQIIRIEEGGYETTPTLVMPDSEFDRVTERALVAETAENWLCGDEGWTARHSWEDVVRIPEWRRALMTKIVVDSENSKIQMSIAYSRGGDGYVWRESDTVINLAY